MNAMTAKTIREGLLPKRLASIFLAIVAALAISVFVVPATALAADDLTVSLSASSPSGDWTYGSKVKINLSFAYTGSEPVQFCDYQLDIGDKRIKDDRVRSSSWNDWCYWDADRVGELTATLHVYVNLEGSAEHPNASAEAQFTINKATMTVEAVDYSGKYDGESHEGGATPSVTEGTTIQYSTDGGKTWTDEAPSITNAGTVGYKVKATNPNFDDATAEGALTVTKAEATVTITGSKESKVYNGEEQKTEGYEVEISDALYTEADFTGPDEAVAKGTNVGSYEMGLAEEQFANTNYNFDVTFSVTDGELKITAVTLKIQVIGQTYVYNGSPQGEGDPAYDDPAVIEDKVEIVEGGLVGKDTLSMIQLFGQQTEVGVYEGEIELTGYMITRGSAVVGGNYVVTSVPGTLEITPAQVTVTTGSASKVYDGKALSNAEASIAGLVNGQTATVTATGSQTEVGSSPNTYSIEWGTAKAGNYAVTENLGTLTVKPAPVQEYTVTFENWDGTVLQSGKVAAGEVPVYEGAEPTRPETDQYLYVFDGWTPEVVAATSDATYTATYTATPKDKPVYKVVFGAGGTWTEGSGEPMVFKIERTVDPETAFSHFVGIEVDGKAVPEKDASGKANWTAKSGSVIIELQPAYLGTLSAGKHTLTALFDDGDPVTAEFNVAAKTSPEPGKATSPKTGDPLAGAFAIALSLAAVSALALALSRRMRRD